MTDEKTKKTTANDANVTVQCRITEKEAGELDAVAEHLGVERSWVVREALRQFRVENSELHKFVTAGRAKATKPHAVA